MKFYDGGWYAAEGADGIGNIDGVQLIGVNTVWDDLANPLLGKKLDAAAGKADYDWENLEVVFQPDGNINVLRDVVGFPLQKIHRIKIDSYAYLHLHWKQKDAVAREFTVRYRIQENGEQATTDWTEVICPLNPTTAKFDYVSGTINQISDLCVIDWYGVGMSCTAQIKLTRTDSVAGGISCTFADAHVELDTLGSANEYEKFTGIDVH